MYLLDPSETPLEVKVLQDRLRRIETAVEATGLGLWEWDIATGALAWNASNRALFGVTHAGPLAIQDFPALIHPDDRGIINAAYANVAETPDGGAFTAEFRTAVEPGGKARWLQMRGEVDARFDPDGFRARIQVPKGGARV